MPSAINNGRLPRRSGETKGVVLLGWRRVRAAIVAVIYGAA